MPSPGCGAASAPVPRWLLAELSYACPLQCPYCSNPVDFARHRDELDTGTWLRVLREARELGAVQLGLSGGEPLLRRDLETLVREARALGYYSNLITSGVGLDAPRAEALARAGLDHIQLSFQAAEPALNDRLAGARCFAHKLRAAYAIRQAGLPMVLCFVLCRDNIHQVADMLALAQRLGADYVELANVQYHGWALLNRARLLPTLRQVREVERVVNAFRARCDGPMKIYHVVADYLDGRPKACVNGWGTTLITIAPDGAVLPCHVARELPGMVIPSVRTRSLRDIWYHSPLFNRFRGSDWMPEPCRSCPERERDFGGCRCQAWQLTGDPARTDPACRHAPDHEVVRQALAESMAEEAPLVFRNLRNSRARCE